MSSKLFFQTQNWRQLKIWILLNIPFLSFFKIPASIETVDQWANQNIQFWPVTTKSLAISSHPDSLQRQKCRCSIATWLNTTQDAAINTALAQPHTSQFMMLSYTTSHIFPNWQDNSNNNKTTPWGDRQSYGALRSRFCINHESCDFLTFRRQDFCLLSMARQGAKP